MTVGDGFRFGVGFLIAYYVSVAALDLWLGYWCVTR